MRAPRTFAVLALLCWCALAPAGEPLRVELRDRAMVGTVAVTVGDVALVSGGDLFARQAAQALDLADLKVRQPNGVVLRRAVEYRLRLAGVEARVTGPERVNVSLATRPLTSEEVLGAARAELFRAHANPADAVIDLAAPIATKLPEIPVNEKPAITAKPRGAPGPNGRVQVDVTVACGPEHLLSLAVQCDVKNLRGGIQQAGAQVPAGGFATNEMAVKAGDPVEIRVNANGFTITAKGTALHAGKLGQTVQVQNTESKRTVIGRVVGPRAVEVELGGAP